MYADAKNDPRLAEVIACWGALPDALRAGILAMVRASSTAPDHADDTAPDRADG